MFAGFNSEWLNTLNEHISQMERSFLNGMTPDEFDLVELFDESKHTFFRIQGLADFWSTQPGIDFGQCITDLVVGAHNQSQSQTPITLVLSGTPQELSVFISLGRETTATSLLEGILPGIQLDTTPVSNLARRLQPHFQVKGVLSGIPSRKASAMDAALPFHEDHDFGRTIPISNITGSQHTTQLERVIRGMYGATWAYVVQALPRSRNEVATARLAIVDLLAQVASQSRIQIQTLEQKNVQLSTVETDSQTQSFSGEMVNYRAQYLIRLLEHELGRLDQSMASGQWLVRTYFGARTSEDAQRLGSLLVGTLAGSNSRPDPLRSFLCRRRTAQLVHFTTLLSSQEVALLMQLPREEVPGYALHDFVSFDTDFHPPDDGVLALGDIQHHGRNTHNTYRLSLDDLTKHALVVGVTGSGKTTTIMNILDRVVDAHTPFLVIEPAKTEYRALYGVFAGRTDLRIYTLGNETVAPFRLNPFEFETGESPESASILSHIDVLKAVFNAAFILYAPMPYVLETALHEVYEDKGWDLASGGNTRLPEWEDRHRYPIFPTLTDLYRKIDVVTTRLGYHDEVERNVKAGLKARIGSMRLGAKGLMLDTVRGIPMRQLLHSPTVLEMETIGSDEEKTFLMGLFLAKLYEYRRIQAVAGLLPAGLQHLLVFEEAHRLLKKTATSVDVESSNMRAQAIEVFTNMLSEMRAYGQGVLVAEQIPSKLSLDILKNTNVKIVHRLTAQDDRESVGQTMNLTSTQMTHLGVLAPGTAAVYAEGIDHAYLVQGANYTQKLVPLRDMHLREISPKYASIEAYQTIPALSQYDIPCSSFGGPDAKAYQDAGKLLETEKNKILWATLLLRTVFNPSKLRDLLTVRLARDIEAEMRHLPPQQHDLMIRLVLVRGCAEILNERGTTSGWPYPFVETMRQHLTRGFLTLVQQKEISEANHDVQQFAEMYKNLLKRNQGPYAGCIHCPEPCIYRSEVQYLLSSKDRKWVDEDLKSLKYKTQQERYAAIAKAVKGSMAQLWLGETCDVGSPIGYCAALHATARSGYTEYEQMLVGDQLSSQML